MNWMQKFEIRQIFISILVLKNGEKTRNNRPYYMNLKLNDGIYNRFFFIIIHLSLKFESTHAYINKTCIFER